MKNRQWGITLLALVMAVILLLGGFSIYQEKGAEKTNIPAPDHSMVIKTEVKKDGTSFFIKECKMDGTVEKSVKWQGKLLALEWSKDASKYIIDHKDQEGEKIEVVDQKSAKVTLVNEEVKKALYEFLAKQHGEAPANDTKLSLEFQSWCDDNEAMFIKYEVMDKEKAEYAGYIIWNVTENRIAAKYEIK